jgi:heptose I phosphotransferase
MDTAHLARALHDAHRYHKDFYFCHFYVAEPGAQESASRLTFEDAQPAKNRVHLIDLHRLGYHPWTGWRWRVKDLAQLHYSSDVPGIDDRDRLRFFHRYLGLRKLDRTGRRLLRAVQRKAGCYRRHYARNLTPASPPGPGTRTSRHESGDVL